MLAENIAVKPDLKPAKPKKAEKPKSARRGRPKKSLFDRHSSKTIQRGPDECWPWTGAVNKEGYGIMQGEGNSTTRAHRVAYRKKHGEIPAGKIIMHSCDTPGCQNDAHLKPGTHKQNAEDRMLKGRNNTASGAKMVRKRKLTDEQVFEIIELRAKKALPFKTIGVMYGVSAVSIGNICRGDCYGWLTGIGRETEERKAA